MNLSQARVLLTGATGGIGAAAAKAFIERGASVLLTARCESALMQLRAALPHADRNEICAADLTRAEDRERLCARAGSWRGGIDVLINNAGASELRLFEAHDPADFATALAINLLAPMQLCHELLPQLQRQRCAHIVNIGSVLGSIGFPGYSLYCATKFGLRGFTEALRRELADTQIKVHYLAPRATYTSMNSAAAVAMNSALGTRMDEPAHVAHEIVRMLEREAAAAVIGWPEKLFARVNQVLPSIVDRALRRQLPIVRRFAAAPPQRPPASHIAANPQRKSA